MITKYDQQYEQDCEALEAAIMKRDEAQWDVVVCERRKIRTAELMRDEIRRMTNAAKLESQIRQAANLPEKTKAQENAEAVGQANGKGRWG